MRRGLLNKRIPTLLGLLILLLGTVLTTFLANNKQVAKINAVGSNQPENVRISNITDTSFTVSYTTSDKTSGSINYGLDKNLGQNALDDRDIVKTSLNNYLIHSITAKNLNPSTNYFFTITSGNQIYTTNGSDFEVTTGPALEGESNQPTTIGGDILTTSGLAPNESIIYLTADNSQVISFLSTDGHYNLTLSKVRTNDLNSYYNYVKNQTVKMLVVGENSSSNVILSIPTENVPTITLSKDYDFSTKADEASKSAQLDQSLVFTDNSSSKSASPEIITPKTNEGFSDQQPTFTGTAQPNQDVQIVIHSTSEIQTVVSADPAGNWTFQPSTPLSPGNHTISITTTNSSGILQTITRSFVVYAETTTPTPTPQLVIDSITPTPADLSIQNSTISAIASPSGQLPPSGNPSIMIVGIIGFVFALAGGLLFLLTRGGV